MLVLLTDTETTGLTYEDGSRVIEIAACLYDTAHASPIECFSALLKQNVDNAAEKINGIPTALYQKHGDEPIEVLHRFWLLAQDAECVAAHRAEFDEGFIKSETHGVAAIDHANFELPWVCTKTDIVWPGDLRGDSLVQLALSLGLGVASAHRAMADVDTMARVLTRVQELLTRAKPGIDCLEPLFRSGMRPKRRVISLAPFESKDVVKSHGFMWYPDERVWARNMPPEDVAALPFKTRLA